MTGDKPRRTLWDDLELAPDTGTEAVKAAIEPSLTAFKRQKEKLLDILRKAYRRGPKSEPFDADNAWSRLTSFAESYYWMERTKQDVTRGAERVARLRELAKALGNARAVIDKVMQDDVGDALRASWWEGTSEYAKAKPFFGGLFYRYADGKGHFVDIGGKFEKVVETEVAGLVALEAAAIRAADDVPTRRGKTQGNRNSVAERYRGTGVLCIDIRPARCQGRRHTICKICYGISDRAGPQQYSIRERD